MSAIFTTTAPFTLSITITADVVVTDILVGGYSIKSGTLTSALAPNNANAIIGPIEVVMGDGSQFMGTISVANQSGGNCPFTVTNNGHLPCNFAVGGSSVTASSYALKFQTTG